MKIDILTTLLGGFLGSLALFVAAGALYTNPPVGKLYKKFEKSPGLKKWASMPKYLLMQYLGGLVQCLLWTFVFAFIKPILPAGVLLSGIAFGLILLVIKIFPRLFDMWIQTTYPNKLLATEFINGSILSFIVGLVFAAVI